jgi:hypothetical protein
MGSKHDVVAAMTDTPTRAELAELYRDSERFAAETDQWLAHHKAERAALMRKNADEGVMTHDDDGDAILAAPASDAVASEEELDFTDAQFDALATVIAELHREFEERIERTRQQLLDTMVRLAMPGERAEETFYALKDRVARMEGQLERQLSDIVERHLKRAKSGEVIDLPDFIRKRTDNNAA